MILLIVGVNESYSQGGSNYSSIGIGDINYYGSAYYAGTNGTSISLPSTTAINHLNPALWSHLNKTGLQSGYWFNQNQISNGNNTISQNNGYLTGLNLSFVMDSSHGLVAAFGLKPKTNVRYLLSTPTIIDNDGIKLEGRAEYSGKGGLNDFYLGAAYQFFPYLELGFEMDYTFGIFSRGAQSVFYDDKVVYSPKVDYFDHFYGWGGKIGINSQFTEKFSLGAFYQLNQNLQNDNKTIYHGINSQTSDTITLMRKVNIPSSWGIGLGFKDKRFQLGLDFSTQDYSSLEYNYANNIEFNPSKRISFGFVYLPKEKGARKYSDLVTLRSGFAYRQLYYSAVNNQIDELSLSLGISLPATSGMVFDIGLVLGSRGTTNDKLIQENFGRLFIDISVGETWFKRYKREYLIEE